MSYYDLGNDGQKPSGGTSDRYVRAPHTGRYVRTPPSRLPELYTPPQHEWLRSDENLRADNFERVPPIRPRQAFTSPQQADSLPDWARDPSNRNGWFSPSLAAGVDGSAAWNRQAAPQEIQSARPYYTTNQQTAPYESRPGRHYGEESQSEPEHRFSYIDTRPLGPHPGDKRRQTPPRKQYLIPNKNKAAKMDENHPYYGAVFDATIDFLDDVLPSLIREVVVDSTGELVSNYLDDLQPTGDLVENLAENLLMETVQEEAMQAVRATLRELAERHLQEAATYGSTMDLLDDVIAEVVTEMYDESINEIQHEKVFEQEIESPVVAELSKDIAVEVLDSHVKKTQRKEHREIQQQASTRLLDSIFLDYLLSKVAMVTEPPGEDKQEVARHLTEQAMLTVLMEQIFGIQGESRKTQENMPIYRQHQRSFTEVALDVITEELCATLDEDMNDYDDYEQGLWNPNKEGPPEWALYTPT